MREQLPQLIGMTEDELIGTAFFQSISDVANREEYDDRLYYEFANAGIDFLLSDEPRRVASIFFHGNLYEGELPFSLSFGLSSESVRGALGKPSMSVGDKGEKTLLGPVSPTDRYDWRDMSLGICYTDDRTSINMLCLMSPSAVPE